MYVSILFRSRKYWVSSQTIDELAAVSIDVLAPWLALTN